MYEKVRDTSGGCDLCGGKPDDGLLFRNERQLCICAACKDKLEEMPRSIRENIENYLIGNVV